MSHHRCGDQPVVVLHSAWPIAQARLLAVALLVQSDIGIGSGPTSYCCILAVEVPLHRHRHRNRRRRESSVDEALVEIYLAGVSARRVEDITQVLWGHADVGVHRERPKPKHLQVDRGMALAAAGGRVSPCFPDGLWLKRRWGAR
jgi:hypothetical protein